MPNLVEVARDDSCDEAAESWRCCRNVDLRGGLVHACLDDLVIALYVTIDELVEPRRGPGHPPKLSDAELVCLAIAQVLLGYDSERRWLRAVASRLGHLFPYVCGQAAYNRRLRRAAPLVAQLLRALAVASPSWCDQWRLLDAPRSPAAPRDRPSGARRWPAGPAMALTPAITASTGGSSCLCWPARTGCQWPGAWPTQARRASGGRGPAGPRRPPGDAAPWHGHPGRQGPGGVGVRPGRGWIGREVGPPGPP